MRYPVALHTDDGVKYGVCVPDIPGCFSAGDTLDEALDMAHEAIEAHIELLVDDGEDIPPATSIAAHKDNPDYADGVWGIVEVDVTKFLGKAEKINITLPHNLIRRIDEYVATHKEYGSRSGFLKKAAQRALGLS